MQRGWLNYVSACILRPMVETGAMCAPATLDTDRLAGHLLRDDELYGGIQGVVLAACQRVAQVIGPYCCPYLSALVGELAAQTKSTYQTTLAARRKLQAAFTPLHPFH